MRLNPNFVLFRKKEKRKKGARDSNPELLGSHLRNVPEDQPPQVLRREGKIEVTIEWFDCGKSILFPKKKKE